MPCCWKEVGFKYGVVGCKCECVLTCRTQDCDTADSLQSSHIQRRQSDRLTAWTLLPPYPWAQRPWASKPVTRPLPSQPQRFPQRAGVRMRLQTRVNREAGSTDSDSESPGGGRLGFTCKLSSSWWGTSGQLLCLSGPLLLSRDAFALLPEHSSSGICVPACLRRVGRWWCAPFPGAAPANPPSSVFPLLCRQVDADDTRARKPSGQMAEPQKEGVRSLKSC